MDKVFMAHRTGAIWTQVNGNLTNAKVWFALERHLVVSFMFFSLRRLSGQRRMEPHLVPQAELPEVGYTR